MRLLTLPCISSATIVLAACATIPVDPAPSPTAAANSPATASAPPVTPAALGDDAGPRWAHEKSEVKPDPAIRFGRLPNGMRYALRRNATPPGQAAIRMFIDTGSLAERDDQRGLAHFMEHMVFNGTRNVPEGEFVRQLERLGLAFGADTNASTDFEQTIYSLNLPNTRAETVDTALLMMRETAGEALLETEAINRERGIILSEERARGGVGSRSQQAQIDFIFKDQLLPRRMPIGDTEILKNAPRELFVEFYEAYYRPENAVFVAVGDFDVDEMERKIRTRFSDWRGQGPAGAKPDNGPLLKRGTEVGVFAEPGAAPTVLMAWTSPGNVEPDSPARRIRDVRAGILVGVLNRRFSRVALRDDPPFASAEASYASAELLTTAGISAQYGTKGWRPALDAMEQEHRRAVQYGVTQAELDREIISVRESFMNAAASASTRSTGELADDILTGVAADRVVTTPADRVTLLEYALRGFDARAASALLPELFRGEGPLVFVTSPDPIAGGELAVTRALQASRKVAVAAPADTGAKPWPYTNFGTPGRVTQRREVPDLETTFVRFENGVELTVRPSRKAKDSIMVAARMGDGSRDLPLGRPNPTWAAPAALIGGGLGKLTAVEVNDALVGKSVGLSMDINEQDFIMSGFTRPADLAVQMQLLTAYATDPAWRPDGLRRARDHVPEEFRQARATPSGVLNLELERLLRSGDPRFGTPPEAAMLLTSIADVRQALKPIATEPIEVVIVGDTTVEDAIRQTAATFGALPARRPAAFPAGADRTPFPAGNGTPVRLTHAGRADQARAFLAWPTTDYWSDPQRARTLDVLSGVIRLRALEEIREKQAVTYSPSVYSVESASYPGYGYMTVGIEAPPAQLEPFFANALTIARSLRDVTVTADELNRALAPMIAANERERENNLYWATALAGAARDPRKLDDIRQAIAGLKRVTPADVQRAAREYLRDDKAFRIVVVPEAKKAASN